MDLPKYLSGLVQSYELHQAQIGVYFGGVVGLGGSGSCLNQGSDDNILGEISTDE